MREGIPTQAMRSHMRSDAQSYAERNGSGGAGMRQSAANAPRATVGSTGSEAERTITERAGVRSERTRRQSHDCREVRSREPTALSVLGVTLGRYCPQIRKHCSERTIATNYAPKSADACAPFGFGFAESTLRFASAHFPAFSADSQAPKTALWSGGRS